MSKVLAVTNLKLPNTHKTLHNIDATISSYRSFANYKIDPKNKKINIKYTHKHDIYL